jgi:RNA polymerase sigma-70 factor (ECF subfamily)
MPPIPSVAEELAHHARSLRELARALVGREAAEDLLQDTALRALRSPPRQPAGLFAWLATVMKHLAANRHRGELRRVRREGAGPAGEPAPSAADDVMQRDTARAVTEALWSLPEPYQGTLVQRFFQELLPAEIAARTATPLATVKSRLQRGLELLRQRLAQRDGRDWRAALTVAFGLPARGAPWFPLLTVCTMSTFGKSAAAVAIAGLAAWAWWALAPDAELAAPRSEREEVAVAAANAVLAPVAANAERAAAASGEPTVAGPDLEHPFEFELRARVVDAEGIPRFGAQIALAPPGCALVACEPMSGSDGRLAVRWRGRSNTVTVAVGLVYQGLNTSLQEVRLVAGTPAEVSFVGGNAPLPAHIGLDAMGNQVVTMPDCAQGQSDCRRCHQGMPGRSVFADRGVWIAGLHAHVRFGDRLAIGRPPSGPDLRLTADDVQDAIDAGELHFSIADPTGVGSAQRRRVPQLTGRVFGADGKPVIGVRVEARWPSRRGAGDVSGTDGSFRLDWAGANDATVTLIAGGGPEGRIERTLDASGTASLHADLILATGRTLRGKAIGADGARLNGARVEFVSATVGDGDLATVGPDGAFAFANLAPGAARLLLWGAQGERLPIAEERNLPLDGGEITFDLRQRPPSRGELRVRVQSHDGQAVTDCEVRAWQHDTARGASLERRDDGGFHLHGLPAGFYRVEVGALATGFVDLGVHFVDGLGPVDLGTTTLPVPATLRIETASADAEVELYRRQPHGDVRAIDTGKGPRELQLPAGAWLALWLRDGKLVSHEFALVAGAVTTLRTER